MSSSSICVTSNRIYMVPPMTLEYGLTTVRVITGWVYKPDGTHAIVPLCF